LNRPPVVVGLVSEHLQSRVEISLHPREVKKRSDAATESARILRSRLMLGGLGQFLQEHDGLKDIGFSAAIGAD